MKKIIVNENQKGIVFNNGKYEKTVGAGKYTLLGGRTLEIVPAEGLVGSAGCSLETLLADPAVAAQVSAVQVGDQEVVLHFTDGVYENVLHKPGKYAFWNGSAVHEFRRVSTADPEISAEVPLYIIDKLPAALYTRVSVADYQKARLYYDRKMVRILEPGTYFFWKGAVKVDVGFADTRLTQMNITGQEIMTQDKVSIRVNFVCNYRITDFVKIVTEIDNFAEQIHVTAQLALRDYVSRFRLDEILAGKDEISRYVFEKLKEKESQFFVEITEAGVKDIILPGEIRDIMNTVLVAEKQAQANVITRREEVASTRSLLNTAKLMEENQTLYKLKELEYVQRICENVGSINLNGSGDMLGQLLGMLERNH